MNHEGGQSWQWRLPQTVRANQQADPAVSHQPRLSIRRLLVLAVDDSGPGPCLLASTVDDLSEHEKLQEQSDHPLL